MESQKIVVPNYLTSDEEKEFEKELRQIEFFYAQIRSRRRLLEDFKIPFPEFLYEKLKPKSLKHISSFPMQIDDTFELRQEETNLFGFYIDCREVERFFKENGMLLTENFQENHKRCSKWKYFELKK